MHKNLQIAFVFFLVMLSLRFFDATFLDAALVNYSSYLIFLFTLAVSIPFFLSNRGDFVLPLQLIVAGIVLSIPMAYFSWGQSLKDTIIETLPYLMWVSFFFLLRVAFPIRILEQIILVYGVLYVVLYFYQLTQSPTVLFGKSLWGDEFTVDRGVVRIIFPGAGIFILSIFMAANKLTTQKDGRVFWLLMVFLGLLVPVLQVTRQFIIGVSMIFLFHFLNGQNFFKKTGTLIAFIIAGLVIFHGNTSAIDGLIQAGQRDAELGSDYIRVQAGEFFLTDFFPSFLNRILGNGAPYWGLSEYGRYIERLAIREGYFHSDVGMIAVYSMFGILPVIGYFLIWFKSFTIPLPKEYWYLKYYLWYILLTSLTWYTVYHHHYIMSSVFALYIYQVIAQRTIELKSIDGKEAKFFVPQEVSINTVDTERESRQAN